MNKANRVNPVAPMPEPVMQLPTLPVALRVYLVVVLGTLAVTFGLSTFVPDVVFLRLITATFIVGGSLIVTVILTGANLHAVFGYAPRVMFLVTGFLAGVAAFLPATWLLFLVSQILGAVFGNLPPTNAPQIVASFPGQVAIYGVLIPLCQAFLFFGFIQTAARGVGVWRGVWLTALLFGLYAFFSASFRLGNGIAVLPGNIIVGLIAAALTMRSGSPFVGALVLSGFNLGGAVYPSGFIQGLAQTGDILSIQWLTSVLVAGFVAFLLVQFSSVFGVAQDKLRGRPAARLWWSPLLLVALLTAALLFGEITTRRQNVRAVPTPSTGGSTIPPISP